MILWLMIKGYTKLAISCIWCDLMILVVSRCNAKWYKDLDLQKMPDISPCRRSYAAVHPKSYAPEHYGDVIMSAMVSQITSIAILCSAVYSGVDQRKHQSSASLAFVRGIHQSLVNSLHKGPVTRKMIPFDGVIIFYPHPSRLLRWRQGNLMIVHMAVKRHWIKWIYGMHTNPRIHFQLLIWPQYTYNENHVQNVWNIAYIRTWENNDREISRSNPIQVHSSSCNIS